MNVYISGAMANRPNTYKKIFDEAQKMFESYGHTVLNPAMFPKGLDHNRYMPMCFSMIDAADTVFMLAGWQDSAGARLERDYAIYQGKEILYEKSPESEALNLLGYI